MTLYVCGINHKTAPITIREKIVFDQHQLHEALQALMDLPGTTEGLILSTCNRTEIYCVAEDLEPLKNWLGDHFYLDHDILSEYGYVHRDADAVRHAMRVACGLDSMVLGETEILGQMKQAFVRASYADSIGPFLERLFSRVFNVAKKVRTSSEMGACPVSLAAMAVRLVKERQEDIVNKTVLLIGSGDTIALAARHLFANNIKKLIIASRNLEKARFLVEQFSGKAIELQDLYEHLPSADVVISATASSLPIVTRGALEKVHQNKSLLLLDLAVPRDIEAEVAGLVGVQLYSIDDLKDLVDENKRNRAHAANKAEEMIQAHVDDFVKWVASLDATSIIKAYREHVEALADEELSKATLAVDKGLEPKQALQMLARNLTSKYLHKPSVNMRKASFDGRIDLLELTYELFDIES